jgi:hypothetical protein
MNYNSYFFINILNDEAYHDLSSNLFFLISWNMFGFWYLENIYLGNDVYPMFNKLLLSQENSKAAFQLKYLFYPQIG